MSPAMRFIAGLPVAERQAVHEVIRLVETGEAFERFPQTRIVAAPIVFPVVLHPQYWIAYNLPDQATIEIWSIGWAWDLPPRLP